MKLRLITGLITVLISGINSYAQKDFEGYVEYHGWDPGRLISDSIKKSPDDKSDQVLRVYFSPGKLRVESTERNEAKDIIIVLLDSGKTYSISEEFRVYFVKELRKAIKLPPAGTEIIAGMKASPYINIGDNSGFLDERAVYWYADSLFFHVPEIYEGIDELIMIKNSRILLKSLIISRGYSSDDSAVPDTARMVATRIQPGVNDPNLFMIPGNYGRVDRFSTITLHDIKQDSPKEVPPPPPPPPKMPAQKQKSGKKDPLKQGDFQ